MIYCWTLPCLLLCTHVSGLYLYLMVVQTFTVEAVKLRVYVFIGWGEFRMCAAVYISYETSVISAAYEDLTVSYSTKDQQPKHSTGIVLNNYHWKIRPVHKTLTNLAPREFSDFLSIFFTNPSCATIFA